MTSAADWGWAPPQARPFIDAVVAAAQADPRIVGLTIGGSAAEGTMDEFSDLDFVVVCRDEHQPALLREAADFAAGLGPLLASFTGEHVGEPRLLIALYGPPAAARRPEVRRRQRPGPARRGRAGAVAPRGCAAALHAAVDLYRKLRDEEGLVRRGAAEAASLDYLTEIEARLAS